MLQHWLSHWLGLDNASGALYLFWSGFFADVPILAVSITLLRKHNCHERGCMRIGRYPHPESGFVLCRKHHPQAQ